MTEPLRFNWTGDGFAFGAKVKFFSINAHGLELVFSIFKQSGAECPFAIKREAKNIKTVNKERVVEEDIKNIYIIRTDAAFRKRFKHSYYVLKFETENFVINVGAYADSMDAMTPNNSYLLCTTDFVNLLAEYQKVETAEQLAESSFSPLMCLIDKNEMTKELLRE
jgi:hypothetical protein